METELEETVSGRACVFAVSLLMSVDYAEWL